MIAFLIDADNFSSPAWVDEAFQALERTEGPIAIRRAYGSAENLKGLADTLRVWAVRPFVNLPLSKNTTDMSLAVDAMELACLAPRPKTVVIGSGDLDFLPLVLRLRERGIKVMCVTERSKMAQDAVRAYDQVVYVASDLAERPAAVARARTTRSATRSTTGRTAAKKAVAKTPATEVPAIKPDVPRKAPAKKSTSPSSGITAQELTVPRILAAVPNLENGEWQPLGNVSKALHDEKVLAKSATASKLFKKFLQHFELAPAGKPNQVRYILPRR
jgi:uncharacterized LabA/DUF88 family protein